MDSIGRIRQALCRGGRIFDTMMNALEQSSRYLPRNFDRSIDNFHANMGIIEKGYTGILGAPPTQKPRPFEIVFETPQAAPLDAQIKAHTVAVATMLERFRVLISEAQNI